jgi:putative transposase
MSLFRNKYRNETTRLPGFDYSQPGYYFITICTADRAHYFGEIEDSEMLFTETGAMARQCWEEIPDHFPFVVPDEFVVMPNHVHGIIHISEHEKYPDGGTQNIVSRPPEFKNKFGPQSQNLASIIRGFKIGVTKFCRQNDIIFLWQSRYYDHIIRNDSELQRIRNYIVKNPSNWKEDNFYK